MPTQVERFLGDDDFIVSKTDLQGRILYGNRSFIELSGYTEAELLGEPHNIIRHPDMPRGVFKLLWDTIQGGHEVWAYVKNLSRDGGFYWVLANVTPSYDEADTLVGYYSVRRKPEPRCIKTIGGIYQSMLAREQGRSAREAAELSLQFLNEVLASKGISYEEFVLSL
jgi:PAS domain S-box-containing protein